MSNDPLNHDRIDGLIAAPYTAMHGDRSIKLELIDEQAAALISNGVVAAFACGSTGEAMSLTVDERKQVSAQWIRAGGEALRCIVHVGHQCLGDARELAAHAEANGARGIATGSPSYYKPPTPKELIEFCAEIAAAAPATPFYYYHIPGMTGVDFAMAEFLPAAAERIPTFRGMKFTHSNLMDFALTLEAAGDRHELFFGMDEMVLGALALGGRGAVGSTYNFAAPLYLRMREAFAAGDMAGAREAQKRSAEMIAVLDQYGGACAGKAVMKMIGLDCGPTRLPQRTLDEGESEALRGDLERMGFFEYCCRPAAEAGAPA